MYTKTERSLQYLMQEIPNTSIKTPLVSIITPSYNSEEFITATIESVLAQTYTNFELFIIDDASTDASKEIITNYSAKDNRIKTVFLTENKGQGNARNIATKEAKGVFIAFLDSDDVWHPEKLEKQVAFMQENNISFSHTSYGFINEQGSNILKTYRVSKPVKYKALLKKTKIGCLTAMYDVSKIGKKYMPELRKKQDYALWLSILKTGIISYPLTEELAYYRLRKNSITHKKNKGVFAHFSFLRKTEKLSALAALYYTMCWGINGLQKYYFYRWIK